MGLPTTRRGRYLYRGSRYRKRLARWRSEKWKWSESIDGVCTRIGVKLREGPFPRQHSQEVSSATYNASPDWLLGSVYTPVVSPAGRSAPPHVAFTDPGYIAWREDGNHQSYALFGYHVKRVMSPRRLSKRATSALNRRITGCNMFFYLHGWFPDDDVLGRYPKAVDITDFDAVVNRKWPVPLGY